MATPGKHPAQVVATPPVSTPFSTSNHPSHLAFSPHGPSPQQLKKSPANSNTMFGYQSGGGHPSNSSAGLGYDSPTAAMALGIPTGLESLMDIPTPGQLNLGHLGHMNGLGGKVEEDERWRRLGVIKDILKTSKGRLSEAGMERLTRRAGLEFVWDGQVGSNSTTRTLIIAGKALALDIDFENNIVKKVSLQFPESAPVVTRHTDKAGDILLRDLQFEGTEGPLTKMLDRFAANLERLAMLDRLSVIPELNCHEAIAGVYVSLEKLHRWEVERLREQEGNAAKGKEWLVREAMCTRSGKPVMHTRGRLGLSLDYWQERRRMGGKDAKGNEAKTWSILLECAPIPSELLYLPPPAPSLSVRISQDWISTEIQKINPPVEEVLQAPENAPVLDWLEPEATMVPNADEPKTDSIEGVDSSASHRFPPQVMFMAKFDPPVILPYSTAAHIFNTATGTSDNLLSFGASVDSLMFPRDQHEKGDSESRLITRFRDVPIYSRDGNKTTVEHKSRLRIEKMDYGWTLTELPFSHPKHLVEILPILRQYAFLSTVLNKSFGPDTTSESKNQDKGEHKDGSNKSDFESFLDPIPMPDDRDVRIDVGLQTNPPHLLTYFSFGERTANIALRVGLNGVAVVVSQNVIAEGDETGDGKDEGKGKGRQLVGADVGRMLEMVEDLGVWSEFIKKRLA